MGTNLWAQFNGILPGAPTLVAQVIEHRADGRTSIVEFPNGSRAVAIGQQVAEDAFAFVRGLEIIGEAPAVSPVTLDV